MHEVESGPTSYQPIILIFSLYLITSIYFQLISSHISSSSISLTQIHPRSISDLSTGTLLFQLSYPSLALLSNSFLHCCPSSWPKAALTFFTGMWFLRDVIKVVSLSCLYCTPLTCWKGSQSSRGKQANPSPVCLVLIWHLMFPY